MLRGEVWCVPRRDRVLNRLQVLPITSQVDRVYACEALVSLNGEPRKAMADQIATVSKLRFGNRLGALSVPDMQVVEAAIRTQLALSRAAD